MNKLLAAIALVLAVSLATSSAQNLKLDKVVELVKKNHENLKDLEKSNPMLVDRYRQTILEYYESKGLLHKDELKFGPIRDQIIELMSKDLAVLNDGQNENDEKSKEQVKDALKKIVDTIENDDDDDDVDDVKNDDYEGKTSSYDDVNDEIYSLKSLEKLDLYPAAGDELLDGELDNKWKSKKRINYYMDKKDEDYYEDDDEKSSGAADNEEPSLLDKFLNFLHIQKIVDHIKQSVNNNIYKTTTPEEKTTNTILIKIVRNNETLEKEIQSKSSLESVRPVFRASEVEQPVECDSSLTFYDYLNRFNRIFLFVAIVSLIVLIVTSLLRLCLARRQRLEDLAKIETFEKA